MLGTHLADLLGNDRPGVDAALAVVTGFDTALVHGFARLGDERAAALAALAGAVAATPLRDRVAEAVDKVAAGSIADEHLTALAGGRAALLGAAHDALLARFDRALGRTRLPFSPTMAGPAHPADHLLAGARSWLRELAITGWRGVDHDLVSASAQSIQALLAEPALRRLAVLLDGLAAELAASCPVATMERLPVRRWADLWTRAMLLSQAGGWRTDPSAVAPVSGRLLPLGIDVHEHPTAVQVQLHAVFEPTGGQPARLVRTSVAAAKVDTIVGPAVWQLLGDYPVLLSVLAEHRAVEVTDVPLLDSGDLVWHEDRARAGEPTDPFATARVQLGAVAAPAVPPLDRHPVRIAEPVLLEGYTAVPPADGAAPSLALDLGGGTVAVDVDRLPACGPLTADHVAGSSACLGLIRWDAGRWSVQPLAVQTTVKRKTVAVHGGDWALGAPAGKAKGAGGDVVSVLRERAGRLLRR